MNDTNSLNADFFWAELWATDFQFTVNGLGGGTAALPNIPLGTSPLVVATPIVPEPTTLALGALGVGALLVRHQRSWRHRLRSHEMG